MHNPTLVALRNKYRSIEFFVAWNAAFYGPTNGTFEGLLNYIYSHPRHFQPGLYKTMTPDGRHIVVFVTSNTLIQHVPNIEKRPMSFCLQERFPPNRGEPEIVSCTYTAGYNDKGVLIDCIPIVYDNKAFYKMLVTPMLELNQILQGEEPRVRKWLREDIYEKPTSILHIGGDLHIEPTDHSHTI